MLVPESGAELARELLREANVAETVEPAAPLGSALQARILIGVLGGGLLAALIAWLLSGGGG